MEHLLLPILCPICERYAIRDIHDRCELCGWVNETDDWSDHDHRSDVNPWPVNIYRKKWAAGEIPEPVHFDKDGNVLTHEEFMQTVADMGDGVLIKL